MKFELIFSEQSVLLLNGHGEVLLDTLREYGLDEVPRNVIEKIETALGKKPDEDE